MTLVAHSDLPTFGYLRNQGHEVLSLDRALHQDIRELHIGFLNMMPDAALRATERQFIRLVGSCNRIAQFFVYPFSLPALQRGPEAAGYIERYYSDFESLRNAGLDALIITGANVANPALPEEPFWDPLIEVAEWARSNVASILCSCLATHALLKYFHDIDRKPLPEKRWGVYRHRVSAPQNPLLRDINTAFDVPHSRYNDISRAQLESEGLKVLAESTDGGVHMAASPDQFRVVYLQGHPEYDANSLLKEFRRELRRYVRAERDDPPPLPENYFVGEAERIALAALDATKRARSAGRAFDDNLESDLDGLLDNTWNDTAKAIFNNWLGLVYSVTSLDRKQQFMPGIEPGDPLGLKAKG
ncbi:MAG: homoserine O-succinyltransferase [Woeseiaceae bacterium]|nr:homoserine O-succinyltransferase [Woeseiaceae bacterium]